MVRYMTPPAKARRIQVDIQRALPGGPFQRVEGGWILECPFRAAVTDSAVPNVIIELDVEAAAGRLIARSIHIERRKFPGRIDGSTLRALPIEQYLSYALTAAMKFNKASGVPLVRPFLSATATAITTSLVGNAKDVERLVQGQVRRRPGREAMERVVDAYKEALADPANRHRPTAEARDKTGYSFGHVSKLVSQARKEGLLGPARAGRAGEVVKDRRSTR